MKKLYVISGATGMTGAELIKNLVSDKNNHIIGFDNFFASDIVSIEFCLGNNNLEFYELDLTKRHDLEKVQTLVSSQKQAFDRLIYINCAAVVHTEHFYKVNATFDTNVLGMKSFLEQAVAENAYAYINCSTSEVYSMQSHKEGGVQEDDYLLMSTAEHSQRTSYAAGKLMTEFFLRDAVMAGKILGCSIRFANVYSDREIYPKHIIPHIINSLENSDKVVLLENAKSTSRTFLHNIDSCSSIIKLLENDRALDGSVYNVGTEEEISILELVDMIAGKMGKKYRIEFDGARTSDPQRRYLSTAKIRERTSWLPEITLSEGIARCLQMRKVPTGRK